MALTQRCSRRCRGHSPPCSRKDGSRIHETPSIPACSCRSRCLRHQAYKCTPRCWGHTGGCLRRGQSPGGGRSKLQRGATQPRTCSVTVADQKLLIKALVKVSVPQTAGQPVTERRIVPSLSSCYKLSCRNVCSRKKNATCCFWRGKGKNGKNVFAWSVGDSSTVCNCCHIPKQSGLLVPAEEPSGTISLPDACAQISTCFLLNSVPSGQI